MPEQLADRSAERPRAILDDLGKAEVRDLSAHRATNQAIVRAGRGRLQPQQIHILCFVLVDLDVSFCIDEQVFRLEVTVHDLKGHNRQKEARISTGQRGNKEEKQGREEYCATENPMHQQLTK
jgi:hypothetical protein